MTKSLRSTALWCFFVSIGVASATNILHAFVASPAPAPWRLSAGLHEQMHGAMQTGRRSNMSRIAMHSSRNNIDSIDNSDNNDNSISRGIKSVSNDNKNTPKSQRMTKPFSKRVYAAGIGLVALATLTFNSGAAHAFKKAASTTASAATATATVASPLVLPSIPTLFLACLLPTLLGYYKSEYGVSYGYGTAIATSSYLILSSIATSAGSPICPMAIQAQSSILQTLKLLPQTLPTIASNLQSLLPTSLPALHALSLLFYGTRLDLFLLYRELFLPRFRAMRERIENRAKKQGSRWARTPFLVSCAFLYFCMVCPVLVTSKVCGGVGLGLCGLCGSSVGVVGVAKSLENMLRTSVVFTLLGFLLGAFGDLNKSLGKAMQGEDALITWGIFRFFRHPNYTGEVIGWVSSCLAGFLAVAWKIASEGGGGGLFGRASLSLWKSMGPYLALSVLGAIGISFVLGTATAGLEFRQKEKYGDMEEYKEWVKKSWIGFTLGQKREGESRDGDQNEDSGESTAEG